MLPIIIRILSSCAPLPRSGGKDGSWVVWMRRAERSHIFRLHLDCVSCLSFQYLWGSSQNRAKCTHTYWTVEFNYSIIAKILVNETIDATTSKIIVAEKLVDNFGLCFLKHFQSSSKIFFPNKVLWGYHDTTFMDYWERCFLVSQQFPLATIILG